jgi:LPS export ABC transporter protein LptC
VKRLLLILNLAFVAVLGINFLALHYFINRSSLHTSLNIKTPDMFLEQVTLKRMDKKGDCQLLVKAPKLIHYAENNVSYITNPYVIAKKNDSDWYITADRGKSVNGTEVIYLQGHVKVRQEHPHSEKSPTTFLTDALTFYPKKNVVMTNQMISIKQAGILVTAKGLKGDLNTGNFQLISRSRGIYDPKKYK